MLLASDIVRPFCSALLEGKNKILRTGRPNHERGIEGQKSAGGVAEAAGTPLSVPPYGPSKGRPYYIYTYREKQRRFVQILKRMRVSHMKTPANDW